MSIMHYIPKISLAAIVTVLLLIATLYTVNTVDDKTIENAKKTD